MKWLKNDAFYNFMFSRVKASNMTKTERCLAVFSSYLAEHHLTDARVLSSVLCGSNSYNLALKDSDEDYLGVYLNSPHKHYSLSKGKDSFMQHGDIDLCVYEFGFYIKLLFKGNPKVIEHLLCKKDAYRDPLWEKYITSDTVLEAINSITFSQYYSFARNRISLAEEAESGSREKVKLQANAIRLLSESKRLYSGTLPEVTLTGSFRDLLLSIRHHEVSETDIQKLIKEYDVDLSNPSAIPESMSAEPFQILLQELRNEAYAMEPDPEFVSLRNDCITSQRKASSVVVKVQNILNNYFDSCGPVLLISLAKLPDESQVGIYIAPTSRVDGFIEGVSEATYFPESLTIRLNEDETYSTTTGIGSILEGSVSDKVTKEITLFEISTALDLINNRAHPWLFGSLFSKKGFSSELASFIIPPSIISRGTIRCLLGRLSGYQKKSHPSFTWIASFTQSILNNTPNPDVELISNDTVDQLLKVQISEVDLPDRIATKDLFDEFIFKLRTAMRK